MSAQYKPSAYQTPSSFPGMIQYLDTHLKSLHLWFDWIVFQTKVLSYVTQIKNRVGVTRDRAESIVWSALLAAFEGDRQSPIFRDLHQFLTDIEDAERPIFVAHSMIAIDIHRGAQPDDALQSFLNWLQEDPAHSIFGRYRLLSNLQTVRCSPDSSDEDG